MVLLQKVIYLLLLKNKVKIKKPFYYLFWLFFIVAVGSLIRLYSLTQVPPALHGDESGIGYNAYSLIRTGVDEYGKSYPFTFRNDFSPLIFYATLPWVFLMGFSDLSTRLPTAFIGILFLPVIYLLVIKLFENQKLALLTTFLIMMASWHIRSSRMALEMIWALFFQLIGILLFLSDSSKHRWKLVFSFISFGLSVITYQSAKITTPLIILSLILLNIDSFKKRWKIYLVLLSLCIVPPLLGYFLARPFKDMRFVGISVFAVWRSMLPPNTSTFSMSNLFSLIHMIVDNYLKHFDPRILFFDSSSLRYFQVENVGMFYVWQIFGIASGLFFLIRNIKQKASQFILSLIIISPVPASLTSGVPFANIGRNLLMFPALEIICAIGIMGTFRFVRKTYGKKWVLIFTILFSVVISWQFGLFMNNYFLDMPTRFASFWGQPLKEAMPFITKQETSVNKIVITDSVKQAYMYLLLYGKKEPIWVQEQIKVRHPIVGYSKIGKYEFRPIDWSTEQNEPNVLLVGSTQEIPENDSILYEVKQSDNKVLLRVVKT